MKIRTDFVTNSSSSSFVVEIDVYGKDNSFPVYKIFKPSVDGNGEPNLNCTAEELLNADSVESLLDILRGAIRDEHFGYFDDQYKKEMQSFTDQVAKSFPDLAAISRIKLERHWSAWGEMASCMIWNNEELKDLCKAVCNASIEEEKQAAIGALKDYLDYEPAQAYGEVVDWPTGFLGSKVNGSFAWDSTPEQLARYVCAEMISPNDKAEEVTVIDMENRTIEQSARYKLQRTGELPSDDHEFRMEGSELTKYSGPGGDVVIPDGVTKIGWNAFGDCITLRSVTIPDSVTSIDMSAFNGCSSLVSIKIPDSVKSIGRNAFSRCTSLQTVTLPNSITKLDNGVFEGCTSLRSVVLPDVISSISRETFKDCTNLISISITENVSTIESYAFDGCSYLQSIVIPSSVKIIECFAFSGCSSLRNVAIHNSEIRIEDYAFDGCSGLANESGLVIVNGVLFGYFGTGGDIVIPEGVTLITCGAFKNIKKLRSVIVPNGVTCIESASFEGCTSLETITIPDSVTEIKSSAFQRCANLHSFAIPDSVTYIGSSAFKGCAGLADENGLVIVKDILFDYFGSSCNVVVPKSVKEISKGALFYKNNIKQISFLGRPDIKPGEAVFTGLNGVKAVFPQGALRTNKTLDPEWLTLSLDADETDLAYMIMYQKGKRWQEYVCNNSGDPAVVIEQVIELMSSKKKVIKAVSENVAVYLRRHYTSVPRERIAWLMEYLSCNKGKELDALRNDPGFKRYLGGENVSEPAATAKPVSSDRCAGMTFVITGSVTRFKNRAAFTEYVKSQGGKVSGSVSSKTDYLVNNDINSASSKNRTAKSLGVPIISEEEFVKRFGKP